MKKRLKLFNMIPMLASLSLATVQANYSTYTILAYNMQQCINDAAHLYNCIKTQNLLSHGWSVMDGYLQMHGKHHFGTTRPNTLYECYVMYQIGQGLSLAHINGTAHQRGSYGACSPEKMRRAKPQAPLRRHFEKNSNWPQGVDSAHLAEIVDLKRKHSDSSDDSNTEGQTTDKENTPIDIELLRTFRTEIEKEHKALTFY
jgi:hypothetical protein